jgi:hypothetical protein
MQIPTTDGGLVAIAQLETLEATKTPSVFNSARRVLLRPEAHLAKIEKEGLNWQIGLLRPRCTAC